jgi:hypothetical protein
MSTKCNTLFVFEGESTEPNVVARLEKHFMEESIAIKCAYCGDIYQFYRRMKEEDFDVNLVTLLKERSAQNRKALADYDNDSFAYIYFFFDYDGHATKASDEQVADMLSFFDNETENGKLFISYPMVEAIRHYKDKESFERLTVICKRGNCPKIESCPDAASCAAAPHYKTFVPTDSDLNVTKLDTKAKWKEVIEAHLCKANLVVNDRYTIPEELLDQMSIFNGQKAKYICQSCPVVAVLSAFPMFLQDYYGVGKMNEKLNPAL